MNDMVHTIAAIFAGITGVAILAVLVSRNSNTVGVINASGNAYSSSLAVALSPITGGGGGNNGFGGGGFGASFGAGAQF